MSTEQKTNWWLIIWYKPVYVVKETNNVVNKFLITMVPILKIKQKRGCIWVGGYFLNLITRHYTQAIQPSPDQCVPNICVSWKDWLILWRIPWIKSVAKSMSSYCGGLFSFSLLLENSTFLPRKTLALKTLSVCYALWSWALQFPFVFF